MKEQQPVQSLPPADAASAAPHATQAPLDAATRSTGLDDLGVMYSPAAGFVAPPLSIVALIMISVCVVLFPIGRRWKRRVALSPRKGKERP